MLTFSRRIYTYFLLPLKPQWIQSMFYSSMELRDAEASSEDPLGLTCNHTAPPVLCVTAHSLRPGVSMSPRLAVRRCVHRCACAPTAPPHSITTPHSSSPLIASSHPSSPHHTSSLSLHPFNPSALLIPPHCLSPLFLALNCSSSLFSLLLTPRSLSSPPITLPLLTFYTTPSPVTYLHFSSPSSTSPPPPSSALLVSPHLLTPHSSPSPLLSSISLLPTPPHSSLLILTPLHPFSLLTFSTPLNPLSIFKLSLLLTPSHSSLSPLLLTPIYFQTITPPPP